MATAPGQQEVLSPRQLEVLALVDHYRHAVELVDDEEILPAGAPGSYLARKLKIAKQVVQRHLEALHRKGWLRGPSAPAVPARPLPLDPWGVTESHLPGDSPPCDVPTMAKRTARVPAAPIPGAEVVEMAPLTLRAEVRADSVDVEGRTMEVVFSTGAPIVRYDWMRDTRYIETLGLEPKNVRLKRLNNSAPLLDTHGSYQISNVFGVVVPGTGRLEGGKALAQVRFSKRADVEPYFQDAKDGILKNVSVGYHVHRYARTPAAQEGEPELRHAVDWEPYEVSIVPIGADDGAKFRGQKPTDTNPCEIVTMSRELKEPTMRENEAAAESIAEVDPLAPPTPRAAAPVEPNERDEGAAAENERVEGIRLACEAGRMSRTFENKLIKDRKISLVKAQGMVFDELRKRGRDDDGPRRGQDGGDVEVGQDPLVHVREGIEGAILHRIAGDRFKLDEKSKPYRGMSMLDIGRAFLNARGVRTTSMDRSRLVDALLVRTGLHTTTDFPGLFEDAANKNLRSAYEAAPQTWLPLSKLVTLSDFKPSRQLQVGDAPALVEILEHGEYTFGTIGEAKEVIQLKTYGRMFGITRQALINDDLNAFGDVPAAFGRKARDIESDLAWAQITTNPTMGDGVALFASAAWPTGHANLTSSGTVISVAALGVGRAALRNQKGIDNVTPLNLSARYLIVPAALETIADQFVSQIVPALASSVNPFGVGGRTPLTTIVEPRLDVASAISWYMAAEVGAAPLLYHGILDGQEGPLVTQMEGFDVDGMKFRCRIDVAFKAADPRAAYKNAGA